MLKFSELLVASRGVGTAVGRYCTQSTASDANEKILLFRTISVIFRWVRVVYDYGQIVKTDSDIRLRLDQAGQQYADARLELQREERKVEEIRAKRENRMREAEASRKQLEELRHREETCDKKRKRAEQLVCALRTKSARWIAKKSSVISREKTLIGKIPSSTALFSN